MVQYSDARLPYGGSRVNGVPVSALAPMQDVTTLDFMQVINGCGAPDYFFTEYFRVHEHSTLEKHILRSITENPSEKPVFAQLIGESLPHIKRTIEALKGYPIAGVDLNMGCPAPKVYKKNVGGGLLRDMGKVDELLGFMRDNIDGLFTVKIRIGFEDTGNFETLLKLLNKHTVDMVSVHGRTVKEMYRSEVHYDFIKRAVEALQVPVLANGNISSAHKAKTVLEETGAAGVMIGRSAIRNPWIFRQVRELFMGKALFQPTLADAYAYIQNLLKTTQDARFSETQHVNRMKKFLNFVGQSVDAEGAFLKQMRHCSTYGELDSAASYFLVEGGRGEQLFPLEPLAGLVARPNCEC